MYLKKIEIQGFKSFAEHVNIEFHEGITCIVGPNGSGKSNISDALKWVLGEQSPKTLRGNKMEDVIFSGTSTRKSRGMAEVTLVIDNTKNVLPIDFSEVSISRRMYRSGESEYYINNNICRLKDIRELIMDTGIGVDGYSIIGQGKIIEIINSRPEERRRIFEEVAGIVKYRTKKGEAERKLGSTQQNLLRVDDIIGELEARIEPLRQESEKAKGYLELKELLKTIEVNLTIKDIQIIENRLKTYKDEYESLNKDIDNMMAEKKTLETDAQGYKEKNEQLSKAINENQEKLMALIQEINQIGNQKRVNEEKYASIEKDVQRMYEEISALSNKIEMEAETQKQLQNKEETINSSLAALIIEQKEKTDDYNQRNNDYNSQLSYVEEDKNKIIEIYNKITAKKSEINSIDNLKNNLTKRKNQILDEKENTQLVNNETTEKYNRYIEERKASEDKLKEVSQKQKETIGSLNGVRIEEKNLSAKLDDVINQLNACFTRQQVLTDMENAYEGYNNAVKMLMKNSGDKAGIHGVVAELIEVPQGLETAIETALGPALQNVVCQTDRDAQKAIDFLKKNNAGRITFLPVESIKAYSRHQDTEYSRFDGYKGVAADCIKYDPKYSDVMEYLLGRVVIVDSLDNAIKMSKKAYPGMRIVTIEGDIINSSGAITGGSHKVNTGSILVRKAEIKKLKDKVEEYEATRKQYKELLNAKREIIEGYEACLKELESTYKEIEASLIYLDKEVHKLENDIQVHRDAEKKREREISDIENEELLALEMTNKLNAEISDLQAEANSLEKTAQDTMMKLNNEKDDLDSLFDEITKGKMSIASLEQEKANVLENIERINKYIADFAKEKENKCNMIEELKLLKESLENSFIQSDNIIEEKNKEKSRLEDEKKTFASEKDAISNKLDEIAQRRENIDQLIYDLQMKKHDVDIKTAKSETQIDALKDKLWDEFEVSYLQAIELQKEDFKYAPAARDAKEIREKLRELGEVNVSSIKEYETVKERYEFLVEQRRDLLEAIDSLDHIIKDMDKAIKTNFKDSFKKVAVHFESIFKDLFGGGIAEVRMEDEDNLLETGIEIIAQPPGKKLQSITLLSGGEKTLTAIALIFAILKVKPTPFCIMDEVEAALDDTNIQRFANYLKKFKDIQFVLVTHQKATMEFADVLYGVTMPEQGISKVLSLKLEQRVG